MGTRYESIDEKLAGWLLAQPVLFVDTAPAQDGHDSCGRVVPLMEFRARRDVLDRAQERRDDACFADYWRSRNAESIDGLPGVPVPAPRQAS